MHFRAVGNQQPPDVSMRGKWTGYALFATFFACGSPEPYTFGESYYDVSGAWCYRSNVCGYNDDIPACWEHAYVHACRLDHTCEDPMPPEAEELTAVCVEALLVWECGPALYDGALPEECYPIQALWYAR